MSSTLAPIQAEKATSTIELRVRFCETDLMGIVHHGSYLTYFEAGRVEWLRRRGVTYATWAESGLHLPVVEAHVKYHAPCKFDDVLSVETTLSELRLVSMRFVYRILRDGKMIAEGATRLGVVDASHKLARVTDATRDVLLRGEKV